MRLLDLFSGIGGFSLGLERAGFETVAFCEIDPVCRGLLAHHWPEVPCYDDITTLTAERLAADGISVDAICGGFPCQDLSFAGKGAGLAGERSGLWREYARLIRELRPRVVIVENVAALLGRGLGDVLGDLAQIGYDSFWDCIPASALGAHHRRDRLWIIAHANRQQHEGCGPAIRGALAAQLSGAVVADTIGQRGCSGDTSGQHAAHAGKPPRDSGDDPGGVGEGTAQPPMGRMVYGLSARMDRTHEGWEAEPEDTPRVATGVPARAARLKGLGNAVVPQIPELIGRAIMEAMA